MKINKKFLKRVKNPGISLLISLGTSTLVLMGAMYTILSVKKSLENSENIERSTQLFFATESGLEAAFFHHNARGAGTTLVDGSQTINHSSTAITNNWKLQGRTELKDNSPRYSLMGLLKEGQSVQIPLSWDASTTPTTDPNSTVGTLSGNNISFVLHNKSSDLTDGDSKDAFIIKYGTIPAIAIDFGNSDTEVLIDWSFSRTHSTNGIQTFSPTENSDCSGALGFLCEDQLDSNEIISSGNSALVGRILPGNISTNLDDFFSCADAGGGICSDYVLTFRSLLQYKQSDDDNKIIGIPFEIYTNNTQNFPKETYTISSDVEIDNFSQNLSITVPEKTAIGAFNYVIFD